MGTPLRYERGEKIGQGTFGKVYKGKCKETGQTVALKVIQKLSHDEEELSSMRNECIIQSKLRHPNIIHMIDSYETETELVVVTEYAKCSLSDLLKEKGRLSDEKVQEIACNIISALYYMHHKRILHRDLKPQNVLIGLDGEAQVCDFGFARTMDVKTYLLTSMKGTPLYMAPEIIVEKSYDHKSDLWSLGCLLYELLIGHPPFNSSSIFQLTQRVKTELVSYPTFLPPVTLSFLQGLLEKEPRKRMGWTQILGHPYVNVKLKCLKLGGSGGSGEFPLTKALSEEEERAKEEQRRKITNKLLLQHLPYHLSKKDFRRHHIFNLPPPPHFRLPKYKVPLQNNAQNCTNNIANGPNNDENGPNFENGPNLEGRLNGSTIENGKNDANETVDESSESLSETSYESSDSCSDDDEGGTVILHSSQNYTNNSEEQSISNSSSVPIFSVSKFGSSDLPLETAEWVDFLTKQMREVVLSPLLLTEKHMLKMLVTPLRNHLAGSEIVEKISILLSLPFSVEDLSEEVYVSLRTIYMEMKVVPNLFFGANLVVARHQKKKKNEEIRTENDGLSEEDLNAIDKAIRLVCFLVYSHEGFVTQFCDSVNILQVAPVLKLFLNLIDKRARITIDTLSILAQILRSSPTDNFNIMEDVLLHCGHDGTVELWKYLEARNCVIQVRSLRILGYLLIHSQKCRDEFMSRNSGKLWTLLLKAKSSLDPTINSAADFATMNLKYLGSLGYGGGNIEINNEIHSYTNSPIKINQTSLPTEFRTH